MHRVDVGGIIRIDERAHRHQDVAGADIVAAERAAARRVDHLGHVVILGDHLQGHEPVAGIGKRHGHWSRIKVEDRRRVQRVAVLPDHELMVQRARFTNMVELPEATVGDDVAEVQVALGPDEVIRRDVDGHAQTENSAGRFKAESTASAQNTTAR